MEDVAGKNIIEQIMQSWGMAAVIIPLIMAFFKKEIGGLITAYFLFRKREFDRDGKPETSEKVQLLNGATGQWGDITIVKYEFSFNATKRGVYVEYLDGGKERISFIKWSNMRKRWPPEKNLIG